MSKVKIQGHASGTGVLTVTAPNTSTDRTITLPDGTGTLLTTDGDGSSLTGTADATKLPLAGGTLTGAVTGLKIDTGGDIEFDFNGLNAHFTTGNNPHIFAGQGASGDYLAGTLNFQSRPSGADRDINFITGSTPTLRLAITGDGRGLSQFTAKAWVNFNGSGTVAINDSHNMSSISDNGTGDYTINVSNAMANTNYAVGGSVTYVTGNSSLWMLRDDQTARNTSYWRIFCHSNWTSNDPTSVMQIVFGD